MKKAFILFASALILFVFAFQLDSQAQYMSKKERRQAQRLLKKKAVKPARKQAKEYEKEYGWRAIPGERPLPQQIEASWAKQNEFTEDGDPAWIHASGNGVAKSKTAAEMQAIEMAKQQLAGLIETRMSSLIDINIANAQLSTETAESITEINQVAKNLVAVKLQRVLPVIKMYRDNTTISKTRKARKAVELDDGVVEVQVTLFYDTYLANEQAKEAIKKVMKDKLKDNEEELKKLMGL